MVRRQVSLLCVLVTLCGILCCKCCAFRNPSSTLTAARPGIISPTQKSRNVLKLPRRNLREGLQMATLPYLVQPRQWSGSGWIVKGTVILITLLLSSSIHRHRMRLFWPNVKADPTLQESLPPGSLGCPLFGANNLAGSKRLGPEYFYRKASEKLGNPRVWMSYFLGSPYVVVSGSALVSEVNNMEFSKTASLSSASSTPSTPSSQDSKNEKVTKKKKPVVFGRNNLMFEPSREKHAFLRKLVGSAMTPQALKGSIPIMQQTAEDVIEREIVQPLTMNGTRKNQVKMENVCVDYTMDIVQRQFLGLNLPSKEVDIFREKLKVWTKAFFSILGQFSIPWLVSRSAPYKAKVYIESKLEAKIDSLLKQGPEESIVSKLLFARDEDQASTRLSREEVVENALLLVLAGAETSAGSLTLAMLLLGLHEDKYRRLVQEQKQIVEKHGEELTTAILDKESPYLDAVVKETLRIGPITGGFPRIAKESLVVDGVQIPKGWPIFTTIRLTHQLDPVTRRRNDAHMDVYDGFWPERWLQPETTPSDYMPFGAGPRYCIGYHLAMAEMKIFLSLLARRIPAFELQNFSSGMKKPVLWNPGTIIPRPLDGVPIQSIKISQMGSTESIKE